MEDKAKRKSWWETGAVGILCFLWLFPLGDGALLVDCRADSKRARRYD